MKQSDSAKQPTKYKLGFKIEALAEWNALDGSVKELFRSVLKKRLQNPHVPGSELKGDLRNCYKIKLRQSGYRLIYAVRDDELKVIVVAVGKREDSVAYRLAVSRLPI